MTRFSITIGYSIVCLSLLAHGQTGGDRKNSPATRGQKENTSRQTRGEQGETQASTPQPSVAFSVSKDRPLTYPDTFYWLPDEHTTVLPALNARASLLPPGQPGPHDFFVAMSNCVAPGGWPRRGQCLSGNGAKLYGGAFVLESSDFKHFILAPGFGNANHGRAVFWAPHEGMGNCAYTTVTHFDEQYAAPGSVLQDPTLPPGNLIMIYEAEIHCPPATQGMAAGWVSVGVTRSADGGRTWPAPIARRGMENEWLQYGDDRYAGITIPGAPANQVYTSFFGDVLPSAFIDDMDPSGNFYIYVPYQYTGTPKNPTADAKLHIARAWLGDRSGRREAGRLHFHKWYQGGWNGEGRGGPEDGVMPACTASFGEGNAQLSYNDALGRYMMTFVCSSYTCPTQNNCYAYQDSLYYSTATSLEKQDWTTPQPIQNSTYPRQSASVGWIMDDGYPSMVSPGCDQGHLGHSGYVFLLKGNPFADRRFVSREFTIRPPGPLRPREEGTLANGCRPHRVEGVRP